MGLLYKHTEDKKHNYYKLNLSVALYSLLIMTLAFVMFFVYRSLFFLALFLLTILFIFFEYSPIGVKKFNAHSKGKEVIETKKIIILPLADLKIQK